MKLLAMFGKLYWVCIVALEPINRLCVTIEAFDVLK